MFERYAIYYAPEQGTALERFGRGWLGRDETAVDTKPFPEAERCADYAGWVRTPRRYGFHATLKAPFRLRSGASADQLMDAVKAFAAGRKAIETRPLALTRIGSFLALCPGGEAGPDTALDALAADCVTAFEPFRAPLEDADRARRRPEFLTEHQRAHLETWGYPYVFDAFRFHMSLTGPLDGAALAEAERLLAPLTASLSSSPLTLSSLCLFGDPGEGEAFRLIGRYALTTQSSSTA